MCVRASLATGLGHNRAKLSLNNYRIVLSNGQDPSLERVIQSGEQNINLFNSVMNSLTGSIPGAQVLFHPRGCHPGGAAANRSDSHIVSIKNQVQLITYPDSLGGNHE